MSGRMLCRRVAIAISFLALIFVGSVQAVPFTETPDTGYPVIDGQVMTIVQHGGVIYLGGLFTQVGGVPRARMAAIDAVTGALWDWAPEFSGLVTSIIIANNRVYVGGNFTTVGGESRPYLAALNIPLSQSDVAVLDPWTPAPNSAVMALAYEPGIVYAGGYFTEVTGGVTRNQLAAFSAADGASAAAVLPWDPNANNIIRALALHHGKVYAGGDFSTINSGHAGGPIAINYVAALESAAGGTSGTADPLWNPGISGGWVSSLLGEGNIIYIGGNFGTPRPSLLAAPEADGISDGSALADWDPTVSGEVYSMNFLGSALYIGGTMSFVNGEARGYCASLSPAGSGPDSLLPWAPPVNGVVRVVSISGSGLLLGGMFTEVDGTPTVRLAGFGSTVPVRFSRFSAD